MRSIGKFLCITALAFSAFGCSSSSDGNTPGGGGTPGPAPVGAWSAGGTTTLKGTIATASLSGRIEITVNATYTTKGGDAGSDGGTGGSVTTTLYVGGSPITLSGTYDPVTGAFSVSGGGYTFTGTSSPYGITGTFTGPAGTGSWSAIPTTGGTATSYCGTYAGADSGTWTFTVSTTGNLLGAYFSSKGSGGALSGSAGGGSVTISAASGAPATGTITATGANGTYGTGSGSGTWTGSLCP